MGYSFRKVCSNTIPKGTYKMEVTDIKFKASASGDTSYNMEVKYTVVEGEHSKRVVTDFMSEKAFSFRLKPFLSALGIDFNREFETARELYEYGIREAKGKMLMVTLGIRTYNGNEYNSVDTWAPLPGSSTTVDDVLNEFGSTPDLTPDKPTVADLPNVSDDTEQIVDITSEDDMPF